MAGNLSGEVPVGPGYLAWLEAKGLPRSNSPPRDFWWTWPTAGSTTARRRPTILVFTAGHTNAASRVVYNRLEGTPNNGSTLKGCDGHGTLNAHIVGGYDNGTAFPYSIPRATITGWASARSCDWVPRWFLTRIPGPIRISRNWNLTPMQRGAHQQ